MGEVELMEKRMALVEAGLKETVRRLDRVENTIELVQKRFDEYREGQIETKVMVREMKTDISEVKTQLTKFSDAMQKIEKLASSSQRPESDSSKWEVFWEKNARSILGTIFTILGTLLIAKFVHF